jgi:hypothetical protein
MNVARIALAAVAATLWDVCYGFLVYGLLLTNEFGRYPAVYRSAETGPGYLPLMFAGVFVAAIVAAIIYAKGYEGGSGIAEGARFGLLLGLFVVFAFAGVNYGVLNIGARLACLTAAAAFIEWTIVGTIIGLVYKPAPTAAKARAAV